VRQLQLGVEIGAKTEYRGIITIIWNAKSQGEGQTALRSQTTEFVSELRMSQTLIRTSLFPTTMEN
jgi:hypothetical protein